MADTWTPTPELEAMAAAVSRGSADAATVAKLEVLLCDEQICQWYCEFCLLDAELRFLAVADKAAAVASSRIEQLPKQPVLGFLGQSSPTSFGHLLTGWPMAYCVAVIILGLGLSVGSLIHVAQPTQIVHTLGKAPGVPTASNVMVGRVTGMIDCVWDGAKIRVPGSESDSAVKLGDRFVLRSGLVEITYNSGATVILQGPITYKVDSSVGGYLAVGKITARLDGEQTPNASRSPDLFTITTPTATVTDLGTEFGVEVNNAGETSAHVFRGLVKVQWNEANGRSNQGVCLKANEAISLSRGSRGQEITPRRLPADSKAFVRVEADGSLRSRFGQEDLQRWQAYLKTVRHDSAIVACYDFQRQAATPGILHADSGGKPSELDGQIEGAIWTNGRMRGKNALRFDGDKARVKVTLPRKLTQLTVAAWLTIDVVNDQDLGCCIMAADWSNEGSDKAAWQIYRFGQLHFGTPLFDTETPELLPWSEWGRSRWRNIAVTVDPSHRRVSHYVDGKKVHACDAPGDFTACFGSASIGNWFSNHGKLERGFCGRIDDLLILSREMSEREIVEMYEAGKR